MISFLIKDRIYPLSRLTHICFICIDIYDSHQVNLLFLLCFFFLLVNSKLFFIRLIFFLISEKNKNFGKQAHKNKMNLSALWMFSEGQGRAVVWKGNTFLLAVNNA